MNQLVFIETSIPSFYFETRPDAKNQARRMWTREWWDLAKWQDELVSSLWVIREIEDTPEPKRTECLALMQEIPLLQSAPEIDALVEQYVANKVMPEDADGDVRHHTFAPSRHSGNVIFSSRGTANTSPTPARPITSAM